MHNYEHKKLVEAMTRLNQVPEDPDAFSQWIQAQTHLAFLRENAHADELIICSGSQCFVNSVVVPNDRLQPIDKDDLMNWNFNQFTSIAGYVSRGGGNDVRVERGLNWTGTKTLEGAVLLIFGRTFEGWSGPGRTIYELHQEYAHLAQIYWRPEKRAYCRFNTHGDLEPIVSVTIREDKGSAVTLVSFKREPLEEYLLASNSSLVRMFDFTLWRDSSFSGWSDELPQNVYESDHFFYRQRIIPGHAAYTRGVQIIHPRRSEVFLSHHRDGRRLGHRDREYVEFTAHDWRNRRITKISTDPNATTNYFNTMDNTLPFELSPAFFRPEVLLKYKADRDKYTVGERDISCRAAWHLEGIDVNEAGQMHAYICDLRQLPYTEQLHWLSYNEPPKGQISQRAFTEDFKGEWTSFIDPLQHLLSILQRWYDTTVEWWTLRDIKLLEHVNTPLTESRDEWAEAFMDLAKLVVEGFEITPLRARLDSIQIPYTKEERSLVLLERLLNTDNASGQAEKLVGLRAVQYIRSKAKGHANGSEAEQLAHDALMEHETFGNHFRHVCTLVAGELETIEQRISSLQ